MKIAVIIPCYKVRAHIIALLSQIPDLVDRIYCVDDACPEQSGQYIEENCQDSRVSVLYHEQNQGVGGAVIAGYRAAIADGATILVKIDGDGQMDPALIPAFVRPIEQGMCDYTKGNRFYRPEDVAQMPGLRLFGNAVLSFMTKLSSGYWHMFDPTNGYTALHASVAQELPFDKISRDYFFESDMLFRLNTIQAVVRDIPMRAVYGEEESSLRVKAIFFKFLSRHCRNFFKRVFYNYFLRDFNMASLELVLGLPLLLFGLIFGFVEWRESVQTGVEASAGTVMLSALPILVGVQMLLSFLQFDAHARNNSPLHKDLLRAKPQKNES